MTTLQKIRHKALEAIAAIDDYEQVYALRTEFKDQVIDDKRSTAARHCAELSQMISNAAKVAETINQ